MRNREIFPLKYHTQRELWNRVLEVAGFRDLLRIYAIRVGAGNRLDGRFRDSCRTNEATD